jgi:hypothetical protein
MGGGGSRAGMVKKNSDRILRIAPFIVFMKIISVVAVYYVYLDYGLQVEQINTLF